MDKTVYVCTGTCGAVVSQEEYDKGLTKCGAVSCTLQGQPLQKRSQCATCQAIYQENETHTHT